MDKPRQHINERLHTGLANSGRAAGMGISYDRYDDESGGRTYSPHRTLVTFPSDRLTPEQRNALNGEVRIIKKGVRNG